MKLYDINEAILDCIDTETGEIVDPERLDQLQMDKEEKIESVALWYKQELAEAEALKKEEDNLRARRTATINKANSLANWLKYALGGRKFKTGRVLVSYRTSTAVDVVDEDAIPEEYKTEVVSERVDKAKLKKALLQREQLEKDMAGEEDKEKARALSEEYMKIRLPGAVLVRRNNMTVK